MQGNVGQFCPECVCVQLIQLKKKKLQSNTFEPSSNKFAVSNKQNDGRKKLFPLEV